MISVIVALIMCAIILSVAYCVLALTSEREFDED